MRDLSKRTVVLVEGPDILSHLQNAPDFEYAIFAQNSLGPLCKIPFSQLAAFVPPEIRAFGVLSDEGMLSFYIDFPADQVADVLCDGAEPEAYDFIRKAAERICSECRRVRLLSWFGLYARTCVDCSRNISIRNAENSANERRVRELHGGEWITNEQWLDLLASVGHRCLRCGSTENITRDHVVPLFHGGRNSVENIQPLCGPCNSWKHTRTIDFRADTPKSSAQVHC